MRWSIVLFGALAAVTAVAQSDSTSDGVLRFLDIYNGALVVGGRGVHVKVNWSPSAAGIKPSVEFWFTPESTGRSFEIGTDVVGTVPTFGPHCAGPCEQDGTYKIVLGENMRLAPDGWGQFSARIRGQSQDSATTRIYWSQVPVEASFTQPTFMGTVGATGTIPVVAVSKASNIAKVVVGYVPADPLDRYINPFEQHVLGAALGNGGHSSCVPTTVGANLAWLNDTGRFATIPAILPAICAGSRDECLVTALGQLMGTNQNGGGTSGAGADIGLITFLALSGHSPNGDYYLDHFIHGEPGVTGISPETLGGHFLLQDAVSVGLHNLIIDPSFGRFLALDDMRINADGTAEIRLMDPHTVNNPPKLGAYRWFHMFPNGWVNWSQGVPAPGYEFPPTGIVLLDEIQTVGFTNLSQIFDVLSQSTAPMDAAATDDSARDLATTAPKPNIQPVAGHLDSDGHTWVGTFVPAPGDPGPWMLVSEVTLASGHKQHAFRYVRLPRTPVQ